VTITELSLARRKSSEECRREAQECRQIAAAESDEDEKAYWMQRADEWEKQAMEIEKRQASDERA
jgi:hypothetical protein